MESVYKSRIKNRNWKSRVDPLLLILAFLRRGHSLAKGEFPLGNNQTLARDSRGQRSWPQPALGKPYRGLPAAHLVYPIKNRQSLIARVNRRVLREVTTMARPIYKQICICLIMHILDLQNCR